MSIKIKLLPRRLPLRLRQCHLIDSRQDDQSLSVVHRHHLHHLHHNRVNDQQYERIHFLQLNFEVLFHHQVFV